MLSSSAQQLHEQHTSPTSDVQVESSIGQTSASMTVAQVHDFHDHINSVLQQYIEHESEQPLPTYPLHTTALPNEPANGAYRQQALSHSTLQPSAQQRSYAVPSHAAPVEAGQPARSYSKASSTQNPYQNGFIQQKAASLFAPAPRMVVSGRLQLQCAAHDVDNIHQYDADTVVAAVRLRPCALLKTGGNRANPNWLKRSTEETKAESVLTSHKRQKQLHGSVKREQLEQDSIAPLSFDQIPADPMFVLFAPLPDIYTED